MKSALKRTLTGGLIAMAVTGAILVPAQASAAEHTYGAIAYSKTTGDHASVDSYSSVLDAMDAAEKLCNGTGVTDCSAVVVLDNNCGALFRHPVTGEWGWSTGPSISEASAYASSVAGDGAELKESLCTAGYAGS